ncbi:GumC family protein [Rhizosphaericola mali]|uniref:Polysaccharide biosynthesis tyrosine autokinase n=1 Tax=Rhizosphaericola mali TaxID=2545455 RepID=A0A5P2FWT5_9BACT|nr:polysaccharide biosynthesis tyrosine autokinase [Rhizosphaericola mali]QES87984.1 polysaccharide biosynthesis tyrosine autokinase [Rhizosphaericola mali]
MQDFEIQPKKDSGINPLKSIIAIAKRFWIVILASILLCLGLTTLYLKSTPTIYDTHAQIIIDDDKNSSSGGGTVGSSGSSDISLASFFSGPKNVDNELGVLKSTKIVGRTVKDLQLNISFFQKQKMLKRQLFGADELPFNFKFISFNDLALKGKSVKYIATIQRDGISLFNEFEEKTFKIPFNNIKTIPEGTVYCGPTNLLNEFIGKELIINISNYQDAIIMFKHLLQASIPDKNTSIIEMSINTSNSNLAELYLNTFIKNYLEFNITSKKQSADSTIAFVNSRIGSISNELSSVEKNIQNFKQSNTIADLPTQASSLVTNTGVANQELLNQNIQLSILNELLAYMRKNESHPRAVPASLTVNSTSLNAIITNYNALLMAREKLVENYQVESDNIQNIDKQIVLLRNDMISNMETIKKTLEIQVNGVGNAVSNFESQLRKVPNQERVYLDLSRRQNVEQELYVFLLQQKEQAYLAKSATQPGAKVLEDPTTDNIPVFPNKTILLGFAFILGLVLPFIIFYIVEFVRTRIATKEDIKHFTTIPIVGEIGVVKQNDNTSGVIELNNSRDLVAEQFRIMRTNIQYLFNQNQKAKTLLLTSSASGEGKSFIATNLAQFLAVSGKKVALLELDLRKPSISKKLNILSQKGISDLAIGNASYDEIKVNANILKGVTFFPSGHIPPNPSELLLTENIVNFFDNLKSEFDYIIVDTAPIIVTDAQILSKFTDVNLFVVRMNYTRKDQLKEIEELYQDKKISKFNLIVNAIDYNKYSSYGSAGSYGNSKYYSNYVNGN